VEGASYGSFFSVIAVICVIYFGVRHLLLRQGEISHLMRTCLALLVLVLSVATVGGLGTVLAGLIPAARKTGVLTPLVFVLFLLIFALIIDNSWHRMRVVPKVLLSLVVLFVFTSESFLTRYNFVEETRDEQEILKEYVSLVDQKISRKCPILRAPLGS
jgi:ABC-type transport system involved in multi-copper enzyme maturation permease subunit